jgi:hypothetical protein
MAEEQDDPNELTWPEIDAIVCLLGDREKIMRGAKTWGADYPKTDLLESALRKLKNRYHERHPSALIVEPKHD